MFTVDDDARLLWRVVESVPTLLPGSSSRVGNGR
jgi:hypothetical protein